jgi:hypothetical protein
VWIPAQKSGYLSFALFLGFLFPVAGLLLSHWYQGQQPPNYDQMYAFALSQLSDSQIREFHLEAENQFEEDQKKAASDAQSFWDKHNVECTKANDPAYKARHPDACDLPMDWVDIGKLPASDSVEEIYQEKIMGLCDVVTTVAEARRVKCLPPD